MGKKFFRLIGLVTVGAVFAIGCGNADSKAGGNYEAVALTTGALFIAHMKGEDERYLYLTDVHYFQRTPADPSKKGAAAQPNIALVRQTGDMYAPKNELTLNRDHLLYYQELREDSPVVQMILQQDQAGEGAAAPATPPAADQKP